MTQELNDYIFDVSAVTGEEGTRREPDLVRVVIPKRQGLELCLSLLLSVSNARQGMDELPELPLFGKLERAGQDATLFVDGGHETIAGKSRWPDMVRIRAPEKLGIPLALNILQRLDGMTEGQTTLPELCLAGKLALRRD